MFNIDGDEAEIKGFWQSHKLQIILVLAIIATILIGIKAYAGTADVTWTQPTQDTTGAALATPVQQNIVYRGTKLDGSDALAIATLKPAALSYHDAALAPGQYCYSVTAFLANSVVPAGPLVESAKPGFVCKTVDTPPIITPKPPTMKTVTTTAYTIGLRDGQYAMVPAGAVALGVPCDTNLAIAALNLIPKSSVSSPTINAAWYFGKCGA